MIGPEAMENNRDFHGTMHASLSRVPGDQADKDRAVNEAGEEVHGLMGERAHSRSRDLDVEDLSHGAARLVSRHPKVRSEEHTSELQSQSNLVCRLLLEKKKQYLQRL